MFIAPKFFYRQAPYERNSRCRSSGAWRKLTTRGYKYFASNEAKRIANAQL